MDKKTEQVIFAQVKGFNEENQLEAVASTGVIDRQDEIIDPAAWKGTVDRYRTNPVILAIHMHRLVTGDSPVIGSAESIEATRDSLSFAMKFAGTELGQQYEQLYRERHMRAFSVGFVPVEGEWRNVTADGKTKRVWAHTKVELLEISAVPVPANPQALARMRAAMARMGGEEDVVKALSEIKTEIFAEVAAAVAEAAKAEPTEPNPMLTKILDKLSELEELMLLAPEERAEAASQTAPTADDPAAASGESKGGAARDGKKSSQQVSIAAMALLKQSQSNTGENPCSRS